MKRPVPPSLVFVSSLAFIALAGSMSAADTASGNWWNRVAAAPKKLAFWQKESPAPTEATTDPAATKPATIKAMPASAPSESAATKKEKASPPAADRPTVPAAAAPAEEKRAGFFSRIPIPFVKSAPAGESEAMSAADVEPAKAKAAKSSSTPTPTKPGSTKAVATKGAKPVAPTIAEVPAEPKKPGFFANLWPKRDESEASPPTKAEKLGPAKPGRAKELKLTSATPSTPASATAAPATEKKPSFWARLAGTAGPESGTPAKAVKPVVVAGGLPAAPGELSATTYVVTKDDSAFYIFGPHQATAADAYLSTGTVVTLKEKSWGWAQVTLADGRSGTMARDAIRLATTFDLIPTAAQRSLMAAASPNRVNTSSQFVLPPADMPDLPTSAADAAASDTEALSTALLPPFAE